MKPTLHIETITPETAKLILETQNTSNRAKSITAVERYATDMRDGNWQMNGQPLIFSPSGKLLDGQHRLEAVMLSNVPVEFAVMRGVNEETFVTIDSGRARTMADVLHIEGHANPQTVSGIAKYSWAYIANASFRSNPNKPQLNMFVNTHPYMIDIAAQVGEVARGKQAPMPKVPLATVLFLANEGHQYDDDVAAFIDGVTKGDELPLGDPRLTLREWVIKMRMMNAQSGISTRTETIIGATARCWNAFVKGDRLERILRPKDVASAELPIIGFERSYYTDVPDIQSQAYAQRMQNISKGGGPTHMNWGKVVDPIRPARVRMPKAKKTTAA